MKVHSALSSILVICILAFSHNVRMEAGELRVQWQKRFGGIGDDNLRSVLALANGDILVGGRSASPVSGTKTSPLYGDSDAWILRLNSRGQEVWQKSYGGAQSSENYRGSTGEHVSGLLELSDGSFIVTGSSHNSWGGTKTTTGIAGWDVSLVKATAEGDQLWDRYYGGQRSDSGRSIIQT